ncbi:hypothetical protein HPB52_016417 [Rhipicephalus sanguineus]|uniref:protein-tyrosine-phosphatase n=1 Tax=Rhipicephalus sanguineus TaxID=34632 RepID=A0A9D4SUQ0_RHISA|nr:hypothetical protein HPB52_016417 [Rhipicephalus sanguineus]
MPLKVVLKNFLNHFETLEARKKLGDDLFEAEFQSLKELTERLKHDPEYACTEDDLSRVILSEYPGVPGSDYINANLIKGASGSRAYIASQGPLPTTVMDFWRMIWECEVQVIIMACNEKESGKYKCERYWPNEGEKKQYGNITVELVKWKQVCPDFLLRTLRARCGTEERTLCQFHYWSWPDHGVPTSVGPIVDLVRLVRDCQASEALPVLVHCSAGCGRTGTICAIDYVWGLMRVGVSCSLQILASCTSCEQYVLVHRVVAALFEQQLRIIDSHTYENLDEDGEPLLGSGENIQSNEKIYENLDDLGLENRSEEKENAENGNPEPNSVATSSSVLSSSDARGGSRSSVITDDEDSQSCKDDPVQMKKSLGKKKTSEEQSKAATLSRVRSLSATNICLEDPPGKVEVADSGGKIVGKATVIRRPSIARLKALFEKSDSDDFKPLLLKRKSLGPSARKAKEFRDQEKSQKQTGASSGTASKKENQTSQAEQSVPVTATTTKVTSTPMQMVSSSSEAAAKPQCLAASWYGDSGDVWEKNVLGADGVQPQKCEPRGSSIYDFLPRKDDAPPRLPPKTKLTKPQSRVVPISALNNTYVNVSDMVLARNELMSAHEETAVKAARPWMTPASAKEKSATLPSAFRTHANQKEFPRQNARQDPLAASSSEMDTSDIYTTHDERSGTDATAGSPKKPSESIYQVPPQPRTTPHMISRPLHRLPPSCDPMAHSATSVPSFGTVPFAPVYHPRQGVSAIRSPDYENVYACHSALADAQGATRQQGTRIVKHHSEYRPQIRVPRPEPVEVSKPASSVPAGKLPLQHSFSDASIYEALRGSLSHQQQEQQRLAEIQAQYAVIVKPKKSGLQKSKTVVSESALLGPLGPSAPPRCRRQPQQDSADSSDGAGCKLEKQGAPDDVAQVHVKPSKKGATSGSKSQSKEGSSSGSEGSGFISGTLSKAFGRLNPFYKGNAGTSEEAKKKTPPTQPTTAAGLKKPDVPKKPNNIAMLRMSKKRPAPQPKVSKAPDFSDRPLSQGPNDSSGSEHWTQV